MSTVTGVWDVRLSTPIRTIEVVCSFAEGPTGTAASRDEEVPLRDVDVRPGTDGDRVTWRQSVSRPMRLNLDFDVVVSGDQLVGYSRAGRLPRTRVVGTRRRT